MELVWRSQGSEQDRAALAEFHADGLELALLMGEFGALLPTDYISVVPDEHTDCAAGHVLGDLVAVTNRYLRRWCHAGGGARAACIAAVFLIECMQEVHQFLADVRGNVGSGFGRAWSEGPVRRAGDPVGHRTVRNRGAHGAVRSGSPPT
ncbi:hypothetical protein ACFWD7_49640 [Streptomyces mirabilis]|uniref:hypothetical protein n=1 Tax=Streptomyces mirabilis TaxID=68239 RepID=UPI0021BE43D8|nr:hypothetical protein [Streptomyces mirabilis]MCT9113904.1 hypothetical protein [Streptomyces mirabilis]